MQIVAISGSLRRASWNTTLLQAAAELAPEGMTLDIVTLHGIPLYNGDDEAETGKPASIVALDAKIRASNGVIVSTPEYNHSIPGALKNATDWLSRGDNPLKGKRMGILGASTGPMGTVRAQLALRQNLNALEAQVMSKPELLVANAQTKFSPDGTLTDENTRTHLKKWLEAVGAWVTA